MARILVVDDDEDIRNLVALRLTAAGHAVLAAEGGPEALAALEGRDAPDAAVLDVTMPEMDGFALLEALRSREATADLPVVFLSARVQDADIARGRAAGAAYLTKPFVASALVTKVAELVEQKATPAAW